MRTITDIFREYVELQGDAPAPRTPLELQTAIEAAGLCYEGVAGPSFWARLADDWLDGTQAGQPFNEDENEANARYCELAVSRGLLQEV